MLVRLSLTILILILGSSAIAQLRIVASIEPYGDLARLLAGDSAEVTVILPPGASPHTFEPSPRDAMQLREADVVLLNGGSDEWLREIAEAVAPEVPVVEALAVLRDTLGESKPSESGDSGLGGNPHVWLDPILMVEVVEHISSALAQLDPAKGAEYRARADEVVELLKNLDVTLRETLAPVKGAPFIPFHDAWPHFARRYGLDLVMEIEPFPGREPSPRYLAGVVEAIRSSGAPAIFNEAGLSDRAASVLADEAGVEVFTLDPLGGAEESYDEFMRRNAETILEALEPWRPR